MNSADTNLEWSALNFNLIITSRQTMFITGKNNKKKGWSECTGKQTFCR